MNFFSRGFDPSENSSKWRQSAVVQSNRIQQCVPLSPLRTGSRVSSPELDITWSRFAIIEYLVSVISCVNWTFDVVERMQCSTWIHTYFILQCNAMHGFIYILFIHTRRGWRGANDTEEYIFWSHRSDERKKPIATGHGVDLLDPKYVNFDERKLSELYIYHDSNGIFQLPRIPI